jgi:Zn-dependent protease with chaperone function
MLLTISYFQGFLLAIIFTSDNIFNLFSGAVILGVFYYLGLTRLSILLEFLWNKLTKKIVVDKSTQNIELTKEIAALWEIPPGKINISIFPGENSDNAFRKMDLKKIDIYIGEKFLNKVNKEEMKFTLSHEIAHTKTSRYFIYSIVFPILYQILSVILCYGLISIGIFNVPTFFIFSVLLFTLGVMLINYFSWLNECKADELGLIKSKNINGAISLLTKLSEHQKNYGAILNLIFYDHPPTENRINRLKKLNL